MRALIAARIQYTHETDTRCSKDPGQHWAALQTAVPCLHPSHKFEKVTQGPERSIQYIPPQVETKEEGSENEALSSSLKWFLTTFPPSKCSCADVAWICINNNSSCDNENKNKKTNKALQDRIEGALDDWEQRIHMANEKKECITNQDVDAIAKKHQILKAKWLVFPLEEEVDSAWRAVAHNAVLPPSSSSSCTSSVGMEVKVSSVSATTPGHILTVYCSNYLDTEEVMKVARMLQKTLPPMKDKRLLLKPDVYTYLGLYKGNEYRIRPTIMSLKL